MAVLSFMIQAPGDYPRAGKVCQGKNTLAFYENS